MGPDTRCSWSSHMLQQFKENNVNTTLYDDILDPFLMFLSSSNFLSLSKNLVNTAHAQHALWQFFYYLKIIKMGSTWHAWETSNMLCLSNIIQYGESCFILLYAYWDFWGVILACKISFEQLDGEFDSSYNAEPFLLYQFSVWLIEGVMGTCGWAWNIVWCYVITYLV